MLQAGQRTASLFSQILVTAVALALYAPLLHFLSVLVVQPAPPTYSLDAITSALGSGLVTGELDVQFASPPSPSQDLRNRALGLALADRLSVAPGAVRVVTNDADHTVSALDAPDQIVGNFTAALRMNDGRWRVVRSRSGKCSLAFDELRRSSRST